MKYLGLYLIGGADFKIDLTAAKRKYYGCFNTIMPVVGNQVNEIMAVHFVKSYCLPQLMYGCEIWPLNSVTIREIDVIWNNGFRCIFSCCWRESVKPLQFYCRTLPISYLIGERQLLFYRRLLCDNIVLRTLARLIRFETLGIAAKYDMYFSTATVKNAVWSSFVNVFKC